MTVPIIPTLPAAPLPGDTQEQHDAKAYPFVAALNAFGQAINEFGQIINDDLTVETDLGVGGSGDSRTITSSTGVAANLPISSASSAGLMSTARTSKLDSLPDNAALNSLLNTREINANKRTSISSPDNTTYPTTLAVASAIAAVSSGETPRGAWNASTNTPALASSVGTAGWSYEVAVAGATNLNGENAWQVGDKAIFNGSSWSRIPANAVRSVDGRTGDVIFNYDNVSALSAAVATLPVGATVSTRGAITSGDGGHGTFDIVVSAPSAANGYSVIGAAGKYAVLREPYNVLQFGADRTGVLNSTPAIQRGIDYLHALGGGQLSHPRGTYKIEASALSEVYDNDGVPVPASDCGVVLRAGVSLVGDYNRRVTFISNPLLIVIAIVAPRDCTITGIKIDGQWLSPASGAGHGMFVLSTAGGADSTCNNLQIKNVTVRNVPSYGIGLQAGIPTNCTIEDIFVENTGADGVDLKARSDAGEPAGNCISNVIVKNHGLRFGGCAGVDMRGIWMASKISVLDFGGDPAKTYLGVRFRTKPTPAEVYNRAAARSTLDGFYVRPILGAAAASIIGVYSGSDDISISNGTTDDCSNGVLLEGNANGSPLRNKVNSVTAINSRVYSFRTVVGANDTVFTGCNSVGALVAGFRNESDRTKFVGCSSTSDAVPLSNSTAAGGSAVQIACQFGSDSNISAYQVTAGRVAIAAVGSTANIDLALVPKGTGMVRIGAHTENADAAITGYILIKDQGGVTRKLAVIT